MVLRGFAIACGALLCSLAISAGSHAQTLDDIASTKTLRIGFIADQIPFAFKADAGQPEGYAVRLCARVADELKTRLGEVSSIFVETTLADAFDAVAKNKFDLLCGAISITMARRELVDFSQPIFWTGASAILHADAPRNLRELFSGENLVSRPRSPELSPFLGIRIGVKAGTTTEIALKNVMAKGGYSAELVPFSTHAEGLAALKARGVDAYFADRAILSGLLYNSAGPDDLVIGSRFFTSELYGIALRRGDSAFRLLVDEVLSKFYQTSEFANLVKSFFGEDAAQILSQIRDRAIPIGSAS